VTTEVKMNAVILGLIDARHAADALDGVTLDLDARGGTRRPEIADTTRSLLALADRLDLLAAMVRQEYWLVKGQQRVADRSMADTFDQSLKPYL
jgi:hypothetical protein